MILGMPPFVFIHVLISLLGIGSGIVVLLGFFGDKRLGDWTNFFLGTTILTSVTGFFLPAHKLLPSHILGILSLIALAIACVNLSVLFRRRVGYAVQSSVLGR